jgi:hypothetical protein
MRFINVIARNRASRRNATLRPLLGNQCLLNNDLNEKLVPNPAHAHKSLSSAFVELRLGLMTNGKLCKHL